jgi:hypothetical protein
LKRLVSPRARSKWGRLSASSLWSGLSPPSRLRLAWGSQQFRIWSPFGGSVLLVSYSLSPVPLTGRPGWSLHSSLRSEVAAGYVNSGQRVHRGRCEPRRLFEAPSPLSRRARLGSRRGPKSCWLSGQRAHFSGSVDGWLLATILLPVPWGEGSRQYPPSGADLVIATLHLKGLCGVVWWSHDPIAPRRTALWETQWGQLNGHVAAVCVRAVGSSWPGHTSCVFPNSCNTPPLRGLPWRQSLRGRAWV